MFPSHRINNGKNLIHVMQHSIATIWASINWEDLKIYISKFSIFHFNGNSKLIPILINMCFQTLSGSENSGCYVNLSVKETQACIQRQDNTKNLEINGMQDFGFFVILNSVMKWFCASINSEDEALGFHIILSLKTTQARHAGTR